MSQDPQEAAATIQEVDDSVVTIPQLNIGESDPKATTLVALEMKDTQKTGFSKRRPMRKKSIDRIFGKIGQVELEDNVDKSPSILRDGPSESDSE